MTKKDFWHNSTIAVLGAGSWGTVLANLAARNCREVRMWTRSEEVARAIGSTRSNPDYWPDMKLSERVHAVTTFERAFEGEVAAVIWALPASVCRAQAKLAAPFFRGSEVLIHATKGVEHQGGQNGTIRRISEVLREEIPCPRVGVISGPNLAAEIARGEPAATVIASDYANVIEAGQEIFASEVFRAYGASDVVGVEWAGTLKNVLAIASGALDALKLGWNSRAMLITRGLAEMVRFGVVLGAKQETFLGLAGIGDLLATCSSPSSRNYRVGYRLAQGEKLQAVLDDLGSTAEGVRTTEIVRGFAQQHGIYMPITEGVYHLVRGELSVKEALESLMTRPSMKESAVFSV